MNTFRYKTNIDSTERVGEVKKLLETDMNIQYWHVDILHQEHVLTVTGNDLQSADVQKKMQQAGFELTEL